MGEQKKETENKLGILVVHGIGSPSPGDTLTQFADALEVEGYITHRGDLIDDRRRIKPEGYNTPRENLVGDRIHSESEPSENNSKDLRRRLIRSGPLPVQLAYGNASTRDSKSDLPPVVIAEAYWADITQLPGGIAGVLRGYFDIFFNLLTLVKAAAPIAPLLEGFNKEEIDERPKLAIHAHRMSLIRRAPEESTRGFAGLGQRGLMIAPRRLGVQHSRRDSKRPRKGIDGFGISAQLSFTCAPCTDES